MKNNILLLALIGFSIFSCGKKNTTQNEDNNNQTSSDYYLKDAQQDFILQLSTNLPQPVLVSNTFRNRYITKKDISGYEAYAKKYPDVKFDTTSLREKRIELLAGTIKLHTNLYWVNDKDITTCRTVVRDLWPCFKNRYQHQAFYYFSVPVFSADGKFAMVSLNYVNVNDAESYGGLRVFEFQKGKWNEFAVLGNWGQMPN